MQVIREIGQLRRELYGRVGFVPTMGNLHAGHLDLLRIAREHADCVVASIFVNRLQFGPNEDFDRYPRTFAEDCEKLEGAGADILFAPTESELYPVPQQFMVEVPQIANELCGAHRPGHFRGVATVVLKLFNIVTPEIAVFGNKDFQQLHIVRQMVAEFNLPIRIIPGNTVRAESGLALSSRNRYLSAEDLGEAPSLYRNLMEIRQALLSGNQDYSALEARAAQDLSQRGWKVDYVAIRDAATLGIPGPGAKALVALGAAWLGKTRLIDNIEICII